MTHQDHADHLSRLEQRLLAANTEPGEPTPELPVKLATWFAALELLVNVPVTYLVPDERMLPAESIRFYRYDWNWIAALVDGAYSIGRLTTADLARDQRGQAVVRAGASRARRQRRAALFTDTETPNTKTPNTKTDGEHEPTGELSGFLLRSQVVSGWPGLEVEGYASAELIPANRLVALRTARLASDLLFVLFEGVVEVVQFREPSEGLHFGFDPGTGPAWTKQLRYVDGAPHHPPGSPVGSNVAVPFRSAAEGLGVVDTTSLASALQDGLISTGAMSGAHPWTTAEFSLELIEGTELVTYQTTSEGGES